jgi:hypothetical protein
MPSLCVLFTWDNVKGMQDLTSKDQVKGLSESDRSTTVFVDPFDTGSGSLKVLRRSAGRLC